jgi:iron complex transport system substrate-binding protein
MKKSTALILILILLLQGCVASTPAPSDEPTRVIVDQFDREVNIPLKVDRIATLFAITGHVTVMLGEGEKIVAVNNGLKRDVLLNEICPSIQNAATPKNSGNINIEELVQAEPDVVILDSEDALNSRETDKLDTFGIPYFVVDFNTIEEQQEMILMMGDILGKEERAQVFVDNYNYILQNIKERTKDIPDDEKIRVYHSVNEAHRTDPEESIPTEWIELIGAKIVTKESKLEFLDNRYFASMEQILSWNPDVILVNEDGVDQYIVENEKWRAISAVKSEQVYLLPNGISRWGHPNSLEIPLGALWTAEKLYPERFEDVDIKTIVIDFYKEYFDLELEDEVLDQLLTGKDMRLEK